MVVLDEDRGLSGTSRAQRTGWQRLLTAIRRGTVGIVLVPASSRLSRLPSDWHRVLELGAVFQTLIAEAAGRYDPRDPHDRRLRGLQGTLFAAARDILRHRLRGTLLNKARGGELVVRLPVG
jgi:DNA invertase Pin-like site-specific DNA recombinase